MSLSFMFPHQNPARIFLLPIRATYPAHLTHLALITLIIFGAQCKYEAPHCAVFFRLLFFLLLEAKQPAAGQTMLNRMTASIP
jgi:hypothetical protein